MSIHDHTTPRLRPGRHVARSVLIAVRAGLVAFTVMAALRVAWRLTASSRPVRTVEQAVAEARP